MLLISVVIEYVVSLPWRDVRVNNYRELFWNVDMFKAVKKLRRRI